MPLVDSYRFDKNKSHKHRVTIKQLNYKLTKEGLQEFQIEFPGITSLREIFVKLRELDSIDHRWYITRVSSGKILKTSKTAAELGAGTELEDKEVSGFQNGHKTSRI